MIKGTGSGNTAMVLAIPAIHNQVHDQSEMDVDIQHSTVDNLGQSDGYITFMGMVGESVSTAKMSVKMSNFEVLNTDATVGLNNGLNDGIEFTGATGGGTELKVRMAHSTVNGIQSSGIQMLFGNRVPNDPLGPFGIGSADIELSPTNRIFGNATGGRLGEAEIVLNLDTATVNNVGIVNATSNWWGSPAGLSSLFETLNGTPTALGLVDTSNPLPTDPDSDY